MHPVYLSISTCFGRLCARLQESQLCFCDTWYLLFCVHDCLVCTQYIYQSVHVSVDGAHRQERQLCFCDAWYLLFCVDDCLVCTQYIYQSLHVSGDYVPIFRRDNCVFATHDTCYSVWMTVWYAGCIPDSHPRRITSTKCRINIVVSPDDGHIVARNM